MDACRNNPFARSFRSGGNAGLAQVVAPKGTFIAYATAPDHTAADGSGDHGVYTAALLEHMRTPGLTLEQVIKRVGRTVDEQTRGGQRPWMASDYYGDFFFVPPKAADANRRPIMLAGGPGPAVGQDKRKARIDQLLRQADRDFGAGRLSTPAGNNACERYREVLLLEPSNAAARAGLRNVVTRYADMAEDRIAKRDWAGAQSLLDMAMKVWPGDDRVADLWLRVKTLRQKERAPAGPVKFGGGKIVIGVPTSLAFLEGKEAVNAVKTGRGGDQLQGWCPRWRQDSALCGGIHRYTRRRSRRAGARGLVGHWRNSFWRKSPTPWWWAPSAPRFSWRAWTCWPSTRCRFWAP